MRPESSAALKKWVGHTREVEDIVTSRLLASFEATLGPYAARCQ